MSNIHFEPLRPNRSSQEDIKEKYEFTHGATSVCVYDIETLDFIKEIPVGTKPDCHATSPDNAFLYIACLEGLYCISQESLEVVKIVDTGPIYATNVLPDRKTLLVHDLSGGVVILKDIMDMEKIHVYKRIPVIPNGKFRCEIGGKGNFLADNHRYLCSGWQQSKMYLFDVDDDFSFEVFIDENPVLWRGDDLVLNAQKTKAYTACHLGNDDNSHIVVVDVATRQIIKTIKSGVGSCGLTMTNDERYVIASNDQDDSITVIDTTTDQVVNTPCAREGFDALGITGYIQGISCGKDDSIYVYGCSGNGAIVRFFDVANSNDYVISYKDGKYYSKK